MNELNRIISQHRAEFDSELPLDYDMASKTLSDKRNELYIPVHKKIDQAVAEVAKEQGFLYVWDVKTLKYCSPQAVDITSMIKRKLGIK